MNIEFEWHDKKNRANMRKHGVDFEEADTVFMDDEALVIADPDHSLYEERFLILGVSMQARLLTVCHRVRKDDQVIRIISARRATKSKAMQYCQGG